MDKKIKTLLIGLAVLCAAALLIAFQLNTTNKTLKKHFNLKEKGYQEEAASLNNRLSQISSEKKKLNVELSDIKVKLESLIRERDETQNKFDLVTKERAALVDKVQDLVAKKNEFEEKVAELEEQLRSTSSSGATGLVTSSPATSTSKDFDDAYWASVLKQKASLELQIGNLENMVAELQVKTERAMEEGRKLGLQLKTASSARDDLERRLVYSEKLSESLSEDLVREKRDKKAIGSQLQNFREENFELKSRLVALGDRKTSLESKVVNLEQERQILAKRLAELDQIMQERVDEIIKVKDDLKSARYQARDASTLKDSRVVQLKPIVVKAGDNPPVGGNRGVVSAKVLAINDENNFVIIDAGESDNIKVGQVFNAYRNDQRIASLEVIQTRKEISAADIKSTTPGSKLKIGDTVR